MSIFEAHNMPFAAAFVLVLLLALVQAIGLGDRLDNGIGIQRAQGAQVDDLGIDALGGQGGGD